MKNQTKKIFYFLGGLFALYLFIKYLLPILLKIISFLLGAVFTVFIWLFSATIILVIIGYLFYRFKHK